MQSLSNDLTPYTGAWGEDQLRHLLRRAMFGVPESQFQKAKALGSMSAVLDRLLACADLTKVPLPAKFASWLDEYPTVTGLSGVETMNVNVLEMYKIQEVENWWFDQIVKEDLSIRQKMTLLWTNHFVTGSGVVNAAGYSFTYLMTCMQFALGNLKDFALAISKDPAMLVYLNCNENYVDAGVRHINENYARELLELFTLGLFDPRTGKPNYSEQDIQEAARALAGWQPTNFKNVDNPIVPFAGVLWDGTNGNPERRDTGTKTFLGQTGNWALADILRIIFEQGTPAGYTAAYWFCQKLYQQFVYAVPNASVIDAMATVLLANNFEIVPVMRALLSSAHFYDVNTIGSQIKSPIELAGSLVREFALTYPPFNSVKPPVSDTTMSGIKLYIETNKGISLLTRTAGAALGQELLNPPNVKGWQGGEKWIAAGSFQARQNLSYTVIKNTGNPSAAQFNPYTYASQVPNGGSTTATAEQILPALEKISLAFSLGPIESNELNPDPTATDVADNLIAGASGFAIKLAQLPEFQLC